MKNKYSPFFAAFNASVKKGNSNTKEEQIKIFTNGRTSSLKDLTQWELEELTRSLQKIAPTQNEKGDKMRKVIIAIFRSMGRTVDEAKAWAEKQGVRGQKKGFNEYTNGELYVLISLAEKVKTDWSSSIRKQVTEKLK